MFPPTNNERFEKLKTLTPIAAVQAWLNGSFGIGDEPALIYSIRKDARVLLSDDEITDIICNAIDDGLDANACLERIATPPRDP
jgi:hypothetical protein